MTTAWTRRITGLRPILDAISNGTMTFEDGRDKFVTILKADPAYERRLEFTDAVMEIEAAQDAADLDAALEDLYDWADEHRVWVDPIA